jgi:hypothetical protein
LFKTGPLISRLLEAQQPDHGWPVEPFFRDDKGYFGSREVVTALAVEALLLVVDRMTLGQ